MCVKLEINTDNGNFITLPTQNSLYGSGYKLHSMGCCDMNSQVLKLVKTMIDRMIEFI